jgi:hypothetical protein
MNIIHYLGDLIDMSKSLYFFLSLYGIISTNMIVMIVMQTLEMITIVTLSAGAWKFS